VLFLFATSQKVTPVNRNPRISILSNLVIMKYFMAPCTNLGKW